METQTALIGAECGVELYAVAAINLDFAVIVYPGNSEKNLAFRFYQPI